MPAGYSPTPLAKKLGIKPGSKVVALHEPDDFRALLLELPEDVTFGKRLSKPDIVIGFYTKKEKLVDVKICAISEVWSGLKVVWRSEHRSTPPR